MTDFSQIACEICRTKKRKVVQHVLNVFMPARLVPIQALARGLPSGYIASIEERLARTEAALLQALSTIHDSEMHSEADQRHLDVSPVTDEQPRELEFNEVRIAKVEEWKAYPLDAQEQQREWMRYKSAMNGSSARMVPSKRQEEVVKSKSRPPGRQQNRQTGPTRKRQRISSEARSTLDSFVDHRPVSTSSTTLSPTRLPTSTTNDGWTVERMHNYPRDPYMGTAVLDLLPQDQDTQSPARHLGPRNLESNSPEILNSRQETRLEQSTSKAKRLSTLHSRKYF
ncbi:unnamed protein product, partial [Aureobasidium vineae]